MKIKTAALVSKKIKIKIPKVKPAAGEEGVVSVCRSGGSGEMGGAKERMFWIVLPGPMNIPYRRKILRTTDHEVNDDITMWCQTRF